MELVLEERIAINQRVSYMLSRCAADASWRDILSQTYCEFTPDKTPAQGDLMADTVIAEMGRFETMYDVIRAEPETFVRYSLHEVTAGKDLADQCQSLYCVIEGLRLFDMAFKETLFTERGWGLDRIQDVCNTAWMKRYEGPVTESARDALLRQAEAAISEARLTDHALEQIGEMLRRNSLQAHTVFGCTCGDYMFRSLTAMVIYTAAKRGELRMVPQEVTLQTVVYEVCAEDTMRELVGSVEQSFVSLTEYQRQMTAIWQVVQLGLVAALILTGGSALGAALTMEHYANAVVAAAAAVIGISICIGPLNETVMKMIEGEPEIWDDLIPVCNQSEEILSEFGGSGPSPYTPLGLEDTPKWENEPDLLPNEF